MWAEERFFRLRKPIPVSEYQEAGLWIHECKPLNILAYARTRKESRQIFVTQFESAWDWIVQEDDSKLDAGARSLKRAYLDFVDAVESVL